MSGNSHLRAFADRIIRLRDEQRAIKGDEKEVYAEAKASGYDKTVLGKLVLYVEKRADATSANAMDEQNALLDLYIADYYGSGSSHTHAHAREDEPEHDPETGEIADMGNPISNEPEAAMLPQTVPSRDAGAPNADAGQATVESPVTPIPEPEAIPPVADPATVASVTGDGERTASSPDAFPGATDHSKPNPWCLDPEECGLSSWEHFCLRCQRVKAERQSEGVRVQ